MEDYTRTVERDPDFAVAYAARGTIHLRSSKDYTRAEQDFARALARDSRSYDGFLGFGLLYHELTLLNHAEQSLRSALLLQATPEAAHALGRVLHDKGDFEKAAGVYREAIKICRDDFVRRSIEQDLARSEAARLEEKQK